MWQVHAEMEAFWSIFHLVGGQPLTEEEKIAAALAMTSALPDRIFTGEYDRLFGADADRTEREKNP